MASTSGGSAVCVLNASKSVSVTEEISKDNEKTEEGKTVY